MTTHLWSPVRRFSRHFVTLVVLVALAVLAAACASDEPPTSADGALDPVTAPADGDSRDPADPTAADPDGEGPDSGAVRRGRLQAFSACEEFLNHMRAEAAERVGPYGLDGFGGGGIGILEGDDAMEMAAEDESAMDSTAGASTSTAQSAPALVEGEDFSGTNNQVLGVDEPDIVKTDGSRIITVTDNHLRVFTINGTDAVPQHDLVLDSWPREMLLDGDRLLILSDAWGEEGPGGQGYTTEEDYNSYGPATVVTQVNIGDSLDVLGHLRFEGQYVSARKIGDIARLVISAPPPQLSFIYPQSQGSEDIARETNQRIVAESTLDDWLATYKLVQPNGREIISEGAITPCERIYRPSEFSGFDLLTVLTINMQGTLGAPQATSVVAAGQTVYASNDSLYVATNVWPSFPVEPFAADVSTAQEEFEENYSTALHRLDISDPTIANYVASGETSGRLLNQFSMHEYEGRLHVATTEGSPWGFSEDSESFLTVFEAQGEDLVQVGRVGNMGRGERIFAVRFIGATAYVVTFRQVDPLYVVDLRNPTAPTITGELKIPGFSSYLHPVGEGLLLGVGQDTTDEGRSLGAKVSLFNVSDPTNPIESSVWTAPDGFSDVEWDHRAFLWWDRDDLAVLPLNDWRNQWSGAIALRVTLEGISEIGRIDHAPDDDGEEPFSTCRRIEIDEDRNWFGPDAIIEGCGPDDTSFWPDYYCETDQVGGEVQYMLEELGIERVDGETVQICWPDGSNYPPSIMRTLVIGESLWSLSWTTLQSNNLGDLVRTDRETFGNRF